MRKLYCILCLILLGIPGTLCAQDTKAGKELKKQQSSYLLEERTWTVEIPLWIPGYAGSFAYGSVSLEGEDGVDPAHPIEPPPGGILGKILSRLFTDEWYLRFFFLYKASWEKNNFLLQSDALIGSVGETIKFNYNNKTVVQANFRTTNLRFLGGYRVVDAWSGNRKFHYELYPYLGARIHGQKIYSDLDGLINKLDINPVWVEPILGLQNQFSWKRWFVVLQGDYGGYFVSSKSSYQFLTYVYYRCGRVCSAKLGWMHLDVKHSGRFLDDKYSINATFSGPTAGIAFHF